MHHCVLLVLRLQRALERAWTGDWRVDRKALSYDHTKYRLMLLYNMSMPEDREKIGAHAYVGFGPRYE